MYLGDQSNIKMDILVTNYGEEAHQAKLIVSYPPDVVYIGFEPVLVRMHRKGFEPRISVSILNLLVRTLAEKVLKCCLEKTLAIESSKEFERTGCIYVCVQMIYRPPPISVFYLSIWAGIALAQKCVGSQKTFQDPFRTSETKFKGSCEDFKGPIH